MIQNIVYFLIEYCNWHWLKYLLCALCDLEVNLSLICKKSLWQQIESADVVICDNHIPTTETEAMQNIPKNTMYCEDCPYLAYSVLANILFGTQRDGYCYYLAKGDFSFSRGTSLLWDGVKECGINDDIFDLEEGNIE